MEFHEHSEMFPLMEGEEFATFVEDIRQNGLLHPIITHDGKILDGRNRYRACLELEIKPNYKKLDGTKPLVYVIASNIRRRHLNQSQIAIISLGLEEEIRKRVSEIGGKKTAEENEVVVPKGTEHYTREIVAKLMGISGHTVQRARFVARQSPKRIPEIVRGETTVTGVETEIRKVERVKKKAKAKRAKAETKERQERPHEVKEYLSAIQEFKPAIEVAIRVAKYGKFSPEGSDYTIRRNKEICSLLEKLNQALKENRNG